MKTRERRLLVGFLSLLWLAGVISAYYIYHKPFSGALAVNIARGLGQVLIAAGIITAGGAVGTLILPTLKLSPMENVVLRAAVGAGVLSLVVLICGSTLGFSPVWLALLLAIILLGLRKQVTPWLLGWRDFSRYLTGGDPFKWSIISASGIFLLLALFRALAPPLKFDALVYHLTLPKTYLGVGRFEYVEWLMYWGMPQVGEMLYTWAMALGGPEAATTLGWGFGALVLVGILATGDRILGGRASWVAIASLLAGSTLASSLAWGYVGWQTQLFGWGMLVALGNWSTQKTRTSLALAGACAGFAVGVKYTAGVLLIVGLVYVLWRKPNPAGSTRLRAALIFAASGLVVSAPWFLKNVLATGNPAYPLLFPAGAMDSFRLSLFQSQGAWGDIRDIFLLPWRATTLGLEGAPGYSASIGPLLLGLGALFWLGWGERDTASENDLKVALFAAVSGLVIWAAAGRLSGLLIQTRLYLGLFPAFSLLAGAGYAGLSRLKISNIRFGRLGGVLIILVTWFGVLQAGSATLSNGVLMTFFGLKDQETYLAENLGWYAYAMQELDSRSSEGPVLMLWEPRGFYCSPHCIPDEVLDRWIRDLTRYGSPESVLQSWRDQGFTQVLVNHQGASLVAAQDLRYPPETWLALEALLGSLPHLVDLGGIYSLYQVAP